MPGARSPRRSPWSACSRKLGQGPTRAEVATGTRSALPDGESFESVTLVGRHRDRRPQPAVHRALRERPAAGARADRVVAHGPTGHRPGAIHARRSRDRHSPRERLTDAESGLAGRLPPAVARRSGSGAGAARLSRPSGSGSGTWWWWWSWWWVGDRDRATAGDQAQERHRRRRLAGDGEQVALHGAGHVVHREAEGALVQLVPVHVRTDRIEDLADRERYPGRAADRDRRTLREVGVPCRPGAVAEVPAHVPCAIDRELAPEVEVRAGRRASAAGRRLRRTPRAPPPARPARRRLPASSRAPPRTSGSAHYVT